MTARPSPAPALSAVSSRELAFVIAFGAVGLAVLLGSIMALARYGVGFPVDAARVELAFGFLAYAGLIVIVWAVAVRAPGRRWRDIGLRKCEPGLLVIGGFAAFIWVGVSTAIYSAAGMWEAALAAGGELIDPYRGSAAGLAALFLLAGPIAAVAEEILYRGLLYGWLRQRMGLFSSVLISALLFTFSHIYIFAAGIPFIVEMLALSMLLALLFELSRSLWPGILCHALNNIAVMAAYIWN